MTTNAATWITVAKNVIKARLLLTSLPSPVESAPAPCD